MDAGREEDKKMAFLRAVVGYKIIYKKLEGTKQECRLLILSKGHLLI
jgi:hypothetical protein